MTVPVPRPAAPTPARDPSPVREVIRAEHVWKTYRTGKVEFTALKDVSLTIRRGEFTAIMGPSGSGKSTFMNILGCLDNLDEGMYHLNGQDVSRISGNDLSLIRNQEIGFVFQAYNLLPRLSLLENVELPMVYADVPRRERRERSLDALDQVGLRSWAEHRPTELSGGQRQRAAIARAVVNQPALILADEPTGNLDTASSQEIMKLFLEVNARGGTIVLITHEADIAAYAGRVVRFLDGRIVSDVDRRGDVGMEGPHAV